MSFRLVDAIFWIAVACCAIGQLAIVRSVMKSPGAPRAGDGATAAVPDRGAQTYSSSRASEIAWAVIPGFALAALLFYTWRAMR